MSGEEAGFREVGRQTAGDTRLRRARPENMSGEEAGFRRANPTAQSDARLRRARPENMSGEEAGFREVGRQTPGDARLRRARPEDMSVSPAPLLVALSVLCSAWPVRDLFEDSRWVPRLVIVLAVVALVGMVLRAVPAWHRRPAFVVGAQSLGYLACLFALFHGGTLAFGTPTPATLSRWIDLLAEAGETLSKHPAPAPLTDGTQFLLVAAIGGVGLLADIVAVSARRPALAGLVILTPFLVAVANSDGGLPAGYFAATALSWLALLASVDQERTRAWGVRGLPGAPPADPATRRGRAGTVVALAAAGVVVAILAAGALPHVPARYLADGLGVSGLGRGAVGFSPSAQMVQDLNNTDDSPILRYRSDDAAPPPLRVAVAWHYVDGQWQPESSGAEPTSTPTLVFPVGWRQDRVPAQPYQVEVEDNRLSAPYLAAPPEVSQGSVVGARWAQDPNTGALVVDKIPERYQMTYLKLEPSPELLQQPQGRLEPLPPAAALDPTGITPGIRAAAESITADAESDYDRALAIQEWLRSSGGFTYSLELAPPPPGMSESAVRSTAVDRFLVDKRGYCVQFSTAMVLMARSLDIPARMATGFLPGSMEDGWRQIRASDAHAWPELYFDGAGWLRFEPTPGTRSGVPPGYSVSRRSPAEPAPTATPSAAPSPSPSAAAQPPDAGQEPDSADAPQPATQSRGWGWYAGAAGVLLLLAALIVPLLARRDRASRLAAAAGPPDRVEALWQDVLDRLSDLGIDVDPTLELDAQVGQIQRASLLQGPALEALERLSRTVENARYAPEPVTQPATGPEPATGAAAETQAGADARLVLDAVSRARSRPVRLRAAWWPGAGVRAWSCWCGGGPYALGV